MKTDIACVRLPAEWEPQAAVIITWPHMNTDWRDNIEQVEADFLLMARAILRFQPLIVICANETIKQNLQQQLSDHAWPAFFHIYQCNDTWVRDYGPIACVQNGRAVLNDFIFNGWGGKFDAALDTETTAALSHTTLEGNQVIHQHVVLEGGAIESNGSDCLLTTSHCLLTDTRNPSMNRSDWETLFSTQFGLKKTLWLDDGFLDGDDTDSHIDTLARFVSQNHIAYVKCDDLDDIHYPALSRMEQQLARLVDSNGIPFRLTPLPWPNPVYDPDDGHRLPATYANFLIINSAVLVPQYQDKSDSVAVKRLQECFPDREIVALPSSVFIRQHGSIHCLTMQLPANVKLSIGE